ncbi:MAG: hypothetical protein HZA91_13220 [Verrucomicrobia bacterium]|nr:hypothetical protein [Verrucomicrobiota bacterium]
MRTLAAIVIASLPWMAAAADPWTPAELRAFAHDLSDYVTVHHIRRDTASPLAGMVYRWYRPSDGRWLLDPRANMLGDGVSFATALALFHRATRDPEPLAALKNHVLPFFTRALTRSDEFFKTSKGICPFWWDDGASLSLADGAPLKGFPAPPKPTSNALAADLAAMFMTAGMVVDDTDLTLAAAYLLNGDRAHYDAAEPPLALGLAAGVIADDAPLRVRCLPQRRWQTYDGPAGHAVFDALAAGKAGDVWGANADALREYLIAVALQPFQPMREEFAKHFIYAAYSSLRLADLWHDDAPAQAGLGLPETALPKVGAKLEFYASDARDLPRAPRLGPRMLCNAAITLQLLGAFPDAWESWRNANHPADTRVSEKIAPIVADGSALMEMGWTPSSLVLRTRGPRSLAFAPLPPATGLRATVTIDASGRAAALAEDGAPLQLAFAPQPDGRVEIEIPFTVAKQQKRWLNAAEECRWTLSVDGGAPRNLIFLSTPDAVRARLAVEVADGLRFWQKQFREFGCVPAASLPGKGREIAGAELSDAAGCAHLLAAIAEYLAWLNNERDWELALKAKPKP